MHTLVVESGSDVWPYLERFGGPHSRRDFITILVEEVGGVVEEFWPTDIGDWDVICVVRMGDRPPGIGAAATLARRSAGLTQNEHWIPLFDVDAVAKALDAMSGPSV